MLKVRQAGYGITYAGWWYVYAGGRGYLWPDGLFRLRCYRPEAGGSGAYHRTREQAESAALNHKGAHAPEAARSTES